MLVSLANRILYKNLADFLFDAGKPVLLGMKRGGHTTFQNLVNVCILNYLDIDYKLSQHSQILMTHSKPVEALDLRSIVASKHPIFGYITNEPAFCLHLKNRKIYTLIRKPKSVYKSLVMLGKLHYSYSDVESRQRALKYMTNWYTTLHEIRAKASRKNNMVVLLEAEELFKNPASVVKRIMSEHGYTISEIEILRSINNYQSHLAKCQSMLPKDDRRQSYKERSVVLSESELELLDKLSIVETLYAKKHLDMTDVEV